MRIHRRSGRPKPCVVVKRPDFRLRENDKRRGPPYPPKGCVKNSTGILPASFTGASPMERQALQGQDGPVTGLPKREDRVLGTLHGQDAHATWKRAREPDSFGNWPAIVLQAHKKSQLPCWLNGHTWRNTSTEDVCPLQCGSSTQVRWAFTRVKFQVVSCYSSGRAIRRGCSPLLHSSSRGRSPDPPSGDSRQPGPRPRSWGTRFGPCSDNSRRAWLRMFLLCKNPYTSAARRRRRLLYSTPPYSAGDNRRTYPRRLPGRPDSAYPRIRPLGRFLLPDQR